MPKKKTTEDWIKSAIHVHGNLYDYSEVVYTGNLIKVKIRCSIHDIFEQVPKDHVTSKSGCPLCAKTRRLETNMKKYGAASFRVSSAGKEMTEQTNLEGYGFKYASQNKDIQNKQKQTNLERYGFENPNQNKDVQEKQKRTKLEKYGNSGFTNREKAKQTMVDRYGFEQPHQVEHFRKKFENTMLKRYGVINAQQNSNIKDKTKLTCLTKYGVEYAVASSHVKEKMILFCLNTYGVPYHYQKHMVDIIPLISNFDWCYEEYIIKGKSATLISSELGINNATFIRYLRKSEIEIRKTNQSYRSKKWLNSIELSDNIILEYEYPFNILNKKQKSDGYCKETNTIYEFHGDYWHGNPKIYDKDFINTVVKKTMGELYTNTKKRELVIKNLGYNLIVMWEHDYITGDVKC